MKALRIILFIVLGIAVVLAVLMFVLPQEYHVERQVTINAPEYLVKAQTIRFTNFTQWSPWSALDPEMKTTYIGTDGEVGSRYEWSGNDDVGTGSQEITAKTDERVDIDLTFIEPWEDQAKTYFTFAENGEGVDVTWGMDGEMKPPMNLMGLFLNMETMIGDDYEKGLAALKDRCEKMVAEQTWRGYKVDYVDFAPKKLLMKKTTVSFAEMQSFFDNGFSELYSKVQTAENEYPYGIYYEWDTENQMTTMAVALPSDDVIEGLEIQEVGGKALKIFYTGSYAGSEEAHYAMDEYIKANGLDNQFLVVEEYVKGPMVEPDSSQWETNIYYFMQ